MNWRDIVQKRLLETQPAQIYPLDARAREWIARAHPESPARLPPNSPVPPFTLALGIQSLEGLTAEEAGQRISQTRLYIAPHLLLVERADGVLDADAFRALGFALLTHDPTEKLNIYDYDLETYKTVPDWLNARYWAHPERWKP